MLVTVLLVVGLLAGCSQAPQPNAGASSGVSGGAGSTSASASGTAASPVSGSPSPSATPSTSAPTKPAVPTKPVHVSLLEADGASFGVGMPIIAWFNRPPTDARAFSAATSVTVNGKKASGAWYFERTAHAGSAMEAHYRLAGYWPAHAQIRMSLPVKGMTAGKGLTYDDSLTLAISTGAAKIATVNAATLVMTVMTDGKLYGKFPVSLGASNTPTSRGTKVIMEKGADISMTGPGYFDPHVQWTQRLTYGGEYLHSAPWNVANIGQRSTSNGCTNLLPNDAKRLYNYLEVGDVVKFPNANGPAMQLGTGYGDWNVSWTTWLTGGAVKTR
ncbi:MAG: L,D-transpeptidase [Frankiales bacterium]|nr:L,D-transpeptidase [Frankiales bacterium]